MKLASWLFPVLALACTPTAPRATSKAGADSLTRSIYKELIEIDTTQAHGTTRAARAIAARFKAARFPDEDVLVVGGNPRKLNVVARLRGTGKQKPLLLLAHLDVVEAAREEWATDPFALVEKDGFFYGRGTLDDKAQAAIWTATLIRLAKEGFKPDRDLVVALTADEEEGMDNGVAWLLEHQRGTIEASMCLNEGGGGEIKSGKYVANEVQLGEKLEESYVLEVTDKGGLSAEPRPENAIYRLAAGLTRLAAYAFPINVTDVNRMYFEKVATLESGQLALDMKATARGTAEPKALERLAAASPWYNSLMRTTCVATLFEAGHAETALPERARATLNCRLMPGERLADMEATVRRVLADEKIKVTAKWKPTESPSSAPSPELMAAVEKLTKEMWPGVVVVPTMLPAATDGKYLRAAGVPTYGVSGLFYDIDDEREHGKDERLGVKQFEDGERFMYRLVKMLSGG